MNYVTQVNSIQNLHHPTWSTYVLEWALALNLLLLTFDWIDLEQWALLVELGIAWGPRRVPFLARSLLRRFRFHWSRATIRSSSPCQLRACEAVPWDLRSPDDEAETVSAPWRRREPCWRSPCRFCCATERPSRKWNLSIKFKPWSSEFCNNSYFKSSLRPATCYLASSWVYVASSTN